MSEAPKKIWMVFDDDGCGGVDSYQSPKSFGREYVRSDIVDELVEALERCVPHVEDSFDDEHPHVIQAKAALAKLEESHE